MEGFAELYWTQWINKHSGKSPDHEYHNWNNIVDLHVVIFTDLIDNFENFLQSELAKISFVK